MQSSTIRIICIIFLLSYARILTHDTLSYVNHIVAKNTRSVYTTITHLNDTELEKVNTENSYKSIYVTAECRVLA